MKQAGAWVLAALLALLFVPIGGMKLFGVSAAIKEFDMIGFGNIRVLHLPGLARVIAILMTLALILAARCRSPMEKT
jgi:hypothetical protein